jgi:hypothetical protein
MYRQSIVSSEGRTNSGWDSKGIGCFDRLNAIYRSEWARLSAGAMECQSLSSLPRPGGLIQFFVPLRQVFFLNFGEDLLFLVSVLDRPPSGP